MKNLKKKLAARGGFTLVELIVVIAILAILAGVAVPVYSGYIKKAHEANDTQLLTAVNTAFAAACVENGVVPSSLNEGATVTGTITSNGTFSLTVSGVTVGSTDVSAKIVSSFNVFYGGNTSAKFGYYNTLTFTNGNFVGSVTTNN